MKRFTETTKWRDPWFRRLSPTAKLLWLYLTDNCSCIGLIDLDLEAARFDIGQPINEKHLTELSDRVQALSNGKYFIPKFIPFQYGELSTACPAHKPILKAIEQHQLTPSLKGYQYPNARVSNTLQEKETDKEKEKDQEKKRKEGVQGEIETRSSIPGSTVIPDSLNKPEFLDAWTRWLEHLKQKRKPATLHAQDLQLAKLSAKGIPDAVKIINHCIEKNWLGLYEPNENNFSNNSQGSGRITGAEQRKVGIPPVKHDTAALVELQQEQLRKQFEQEAQDRLAAGQAGV